MIVAIDGPAGSGKSTVARTVAQKLGCLYLDSGAIYRALGLALAGQGIVKEDEVVFNNLSSILERLPLSFDVDEGNLIIRLSGRLLTDELRTPEASNLASVVSQYPEVREFATKIQRKLAFSGCAVVDGRDAATVVFPDACLKIFLTASPEVRAQRRWQEYRRRGQHITFDDVLRDLIERDKRDSSRQCAPMRVAPDAVVIDTSEMSISEVSDYVLSLVKEYCFGNSIRS
ncbi:MAG: (d)CMP kinase [Deltaproteobacteria bacterium]|nr:(d)CMP kinase [Deltaproteobacteria bacterium]MBW2068145.1 (d)CMP kinase [Deltaproteobacteria bacterium]